MATLGTFNENDREGYISLAKATELAAEKRRLVKIEGVDPRTKGMTFGNLFNRWLKSRQIKKEVLGSGYWPLRTAHSHAARKPRIGRFEAP